MFCQLPYTLSQATCSNFESFTFGVIADCQCESNSCNAQFMLQDAVDYFNNNSNIEFCAHLGDFWQDDFSYRGLVQPIYESLNADHHYALGNHEFDGLGQSEQMNLPNVLGMPDWYYDFSVYNWRFIVIESYELATGSALAHPELATERDSLLNAFPGQSYSGCISQSQLDYIDATITTAQANDENVVLFAHHPLVYSSSNFQVRNRQSLIDILESYDNVVAYMNGHGHSSELQVQNGINYVTFDDMKNSTPATFSIVEVKQDTIEIQGFGQADDHTLLFTSKIQILDDDGDNVCNDVDLCPGFDDGLIGMPCNDNDGCTIGETWDTNCNCSGGVLQDQDNDGICDADDLCPSFNNNLIGMACDDNDNCTTGETWDSSCNCTGGVFQDSDGDGVCDANDTCPTFNNSQIGMPCTDFDNCTINDTWGTDCICRGIFQDSDGDGVCDADDICPAFNDNQIGIPCTDFDDCTVGDIWDINCNCIGTFQDSDSDGVCDAQDICASGDDNQDSDNDGTPDACDVCDGNLIGMPCNDNDMCTVNDTFDANCNCLGTFMDSDGDGICDALDNDCTTLHSDNFETNSGIWQSGGIDAEYVNSVFSPDGDYSMRIRDNSFDVSSIFSTPIDLSSNTDDLNIRFSYQPVGMEEFESFILEMSVDQGMTFTVIQEWVSGIDFVNNTIYTESVQLPNSASSANTIFKFRCNASINSDEVFLDNIVIETCAAECEDFVFNLMNAAATESLIAQIAIESNHIVQPNTVIEYNAGDYILLTEGFEVVSQANFHAFIEGCQ